MQTLQKVIISILVLAILVVGYLIYTSNKSSNYNNPTSTTTPNSSNNYTRASNNNSSKSTMDVGKILAEDPGSGATTDQFAAFSAKVASYSVDTTSVNITGCFPKPAVAKVMLHKPITFNNADKVGHKLINGKIVIDIGANTSKAIAPNFQGPGIYGYSCDSKIVGIFLVIP